MQCVSDLGKLRSSVISRVRRLREIVLPIATPFGSEDRRALAFVTIELDNLVIVGLRQYMKGSLLRSRTAAGVRITASVRPASTEEAAALIFRSLNPTGFKKKSNPTTISEKEEIAVRDPKQTEKVFNDYNSSNLPNLITALSLNATVFTEVKVCRHFFAHRAQNTHEAVREFAAQRGVVGVQMPEQLIVRGRPDTGVRFLDGWLADVENFFDLAT